MERDSKIVVYAEKGTRDLASAIIRVNNRIARWRGGWAVWDALNLQAQPPSTQDWSPAGIQVVLKRMPFVHDVVVDQSREFPPAMTKILVRLKWWVPRSRQDWCEEQIQEALVPRTPHGSSYGLEFV